MQPCDGREVREGGVATVVMSVAEAVGRDIKLIARRDKALADSALAATALALAALIDDPSNSATSKSMCARSLRETLDRLLELAPPVVEDDRLDDLSARRERRRSKVSAG